MADHTITLSDAAEAGFEAEAASQGTTADAAIAEHLESVGTAIGAGETLITLTLDPGLAAKLNAALAIDNANNNTGLTPETWLLQSLEALTASHSGAILTSAAMRATQSLLEAGAGDPSLLATIQGLLNPTDLVILTSSLQSNPQVAFEEIPVVDA